MKAQLVKSSEVDKELFTRVVNLLQAEPGPIQFGYDQTAVINFNEDELLDDHVATRGDFEKIEMLRDRVQACYSRKFPMERSAATWSVLFRKCDGYRVEHKIPDDDFVLLLTDVPNKENWFASLDEHMPHNGFIHTADWDHYIDCSPAFPIAYEVVALMLQKQVFQGKAALRQTVHETPIGCVNDMCIQKREIILKLRTADICRACLEKMKQSISMPVIQHALRLMESLRVKMLYAQNFRQESPLSPLHIDARNNIFLPAFGNIEIKLRPLEKALYFLFLRHPAGIYLSSLTDHRQELYELYTSLSNMGERRQMQARIDDMVNVLNNSASEKISRIKRVFEEAIGHDLATHYYIKGQVADVKRIALEPALVHKMSNSKCL